MGRAIDGVKGREWEERLRRYADSQLTVGEFCWRLVRQVKAGGHDSISSTSTSTVSLSTSTMRRNRTPQPL